jgi:hypothetical protein
MSQNMHFTDRIAQPVFSPKAICEGCGLPISTMQDWRFAPNGGYLHRACEVSK